MYKTPAYPGYPFLMLPDPYHPNSSVSSSVSTPSFLTFPPPVGDLDAAGLPVSGGSILRQHEALVLFVQISRYPSILWHQVQLLHTCSGCPRRSFMWRVWINSFQSVPTLRDGSFWFPSPMTTILFLVIFAWKNQIHRFTNLWHLSLLDVYLTCNVWKIFYFSQKMASCLGWTLRIYSRLPAREI